MLIRLLVLRICKNAWEIRLLLRHYRDAQVREQTMERPFEAMDRRITRNARLSLIWAILAIQRERPALLAGGFAAAVGIVGMVLLRATGVVN